MMASRRSSLGEPALCVYCTDGALPPSSRTKTEGRPQANTILGGVGLRANF
jgi:hypothetical protein